MSVRRSGGMADAYGSGPYGSNTVWVQVPFPAEKKRNYRSGFAFFIAMSYDTFPILMYIR